MRKWYIWWINKQGYKRINKKVLIRLLLWLWWESPELATLRTGVVTEQCWAAHLDQLTVETRVQTVSSLPHSSSFSSSPLLLLLLMMMLTLLSLHLCLHLDSLCWGVTLLELVSSLWCQVSRPVNWLLRQLEPHHLTPHLMTQAVQRILMQIHLLLAVDSKLIVGIILRASLSNTCDTNHGILSITWSEWRLTPYCRYSGSSYSPAWWCSISSSPGPWTSSVTQLLIHHYPPSFLSGVCPCRARSKTWWRGP